MAGIKVGHHTLTERPTGCTVILVDGDGASGGVWTSPASGRRHSATAQHTAATTNHIPPRRIAAPDWAAFEAEFVARLAAALGAAATPVPWPDFNEAEVSGLTEQYSPPEWNEFR